MQRSLTSLLKEGFYVLLPDAKARTVINGSRRYDRMKMREIGPDAHEELAFDQQAAHLLLVLDGSLHGNDMVGSLHPYSLLYQPAGTPLEPLVLRQAHLFHVMLEPALLESFTAYGSLPEQYIERACGIGVKLTMKMLYEFRHNDQFTGLDCHCLAFELLAQISRMEITEGRRAPEWLDEALEYIHEHYRESIHLRDVARYVDVDPLEFSRTFRRFHNMNMNMYLRRLRVHRACNLLHSKEPALAELAQDLGFTDQSHFTKVFKMFTGMTPGAYQQQR